MWKRKGRMEPGKDGARERKCGGKRWTELLNTNLLEDFFAERFPREGDGQGEGHFIPDLNDSLGAPEFVSSQGPRPRHAHLQSLSPAVYITYIHNNTTYIHTYIHTCIHTCKKNENANLAATEWSRSPGRARMPVH